MRIFFLEEIDTDENCELDHQSSKEILWKKPEDMTERKCREKEKVHMYQGTESNSCGC